MQGLGFRAFVLYVIKGFVPGVVVLILTLAVLAMKNLIISGFLSTGYVQADSINKIILYIIGALYVLGIALIVLGVLINILHYINARFSLDTYEFKLRRGIISRDEVSIPYRQIQDVNVDQSVIGRLIGVGKIIILTAGNEDHDKNGEQNEVVFDIVDISVAKSLQAELMKRSSVQLVKNA